MLSINIRGWNEILFDSFKKRGAKWYIRKLAEECCELGAAINQLDTKGESVENYERVLEEMAHVQICIEALYENLHMQEAVNSFRIEKQKQIERANKYVS